MSISQRDLDQVYADRKQSHGGLKEDYFALLYLEDEFGLSRDQAAGQG